MSGQIYIIGDSHIGLADGDEARIVAWLDRLAVLRPKALFLNGDVFHYFIGHRNFVTTSVEKFFAKLNELRNAGIEIHYVEGNRDFFLEGSVAERSVSTLSIRRDIVAGSRRILVIHGDMINDRDWMYRFWRRFSKNPIMRFAVKLIPKGIAKKIVDEMEAKLARTNFKHRYRIPTEIMEAYGRRCASEGYDIVVLGHFHKKLEIPAGDALVCVLPAWFDGGEAMAVDPETGEWGWVSV
ncbi:MAG: UDP-2,3-diacylglucosamine diphosphatase [Acidobacteria bacterium]|nr:UDP-2,3-diacylglucosamine diphosphatase [Acidobacteriota bacterium]